MDKIPVEKIGVLGCGWLGLGVAKQLLKKGYEVSGTARSTDQLSALNEAGITPFHIEIKDKHVYGDLKAFLEPISQLVITLPPDLKNQKSSFAYRLKMVLTFAQVYSIDRVLFTSSTSVFQDTAEIPIYDENTKPNATNERGVELIHAEETVLSMAESPVILRLGGLIGDDRHPVKYLAGRKDIPNPEAPVNLTNRNYAVERIIDLIIQKNSEQVYHLISEPHKSRSAYYKQMAQHLELPELGFANSDISKGKKIVSLF